MKVLESARFALLAALAALAAIAVLRPGDGRASAQAALRGAGQYEFLATHNNTDSAVFFIIDTETRRFAMYQNQNRSQPQNFKLFVARHWGPDLEHNDLSGRSQGYSVADVRRHK